MSAFAATHFANAARVVGLHMRGGIPGADNRWVNAFGRGPASLHAFERNARRCAAAVALNESASASTSSRRAVRRAAYQREGGHADTPGDGDGGGGGGGVVVFVASDSAPMRQRTVPNPHPHPKPKPKPKPKP